MRKQNHIQEKTVLEKSKLTLPVNTTYLENLVDPHETSSMKTGRKIVQSTPR